MKTFLFSLALIASLVPAARADDECILNYRELTSALDVSAQLLKSKGHVRWQPRARTLTQAVVLKNGQRVAYQAGGCEHYSFSYTFGGQRLPEDAKAALARAEALLRATPVTAEKEGERDLIVAALAEAQAQPEPGQIEEATLAFPCGDATCYLSGGRGRSLSVNYSFAL